MPDNYFVLSCPEPFDWEDSALFEATPLPTDEISWCIGRPFKAKPSEPIPIVLDPTHSDRLLPYYDVDAIIITRPVMQALLDSGVQNLDIYSARISHPESGFETTDYVAANLIGLVSAVDLKKSNVVGGSSDLRLDTDLDGFVVDPARVRGALMFRLAENTSAVLVHESLRKPLDKASQGLLQFIEPSNWVG
jgi:hypothetical protein